MQTALRIFQVKNTRENPTSPLAKPALIIRVRDEPEKPLSPCVGTPYLILITITGDHTIYTVVVNGTKYLVVSKNW